MPTEDEIRLRLKEDFHYYARACLKIKEKSEEESGKIIPFILNSAQRYIHSKLEEQLKKIGKVRAIILKGRQQGCSTYIEGRFFWKVTHKEGIQAFILTQDSKATRNLFRMAQIYYENCPDPVKPRIGKQNEEELTFPDLLSGYKVGTARTKAEGRSSTLQLFHGSEVSHWPNASLHAGGILQAVPRAKGTEVILESTANGIGNYFHTQWKKAILKKGEYIPIFIPWFWQDEYKEVIPEGFAITPEEEEIRKLYNLSLEQLMWRRIKIEELDANEMSGEKMFMQEYPCTPAEAFQSTSGDSFISSNSVMKARQSDYNKPYGPKLIGVDPAGPGKDRTSIIFRQGRVVYNLKSFNEPDTMKTTGIIHKLIREENPDKVLIDVIGIGAGIVDRLKELGYSGIVKGINAGGSPYNAEKYKNIRAEMWGVMKEWFMDEPCSIPDEDSLHEDLCCVGYSYTSNTQIILEKKDEIKKRHRSPDEADALALTFSFPCVDNSVNIRKLLNPSIKI